MADVAIHPSTSAPLLTTISATRELFNKHFDRGWLAMSIDDLPIDFTTFRQIRELLAVKEIYPEDVDELRQGVMQLRRFAGDLRRHLLPILKERLGVSGLVPTRYRMEQSERVHRQLLYMSFPHNLARLEELCSELESLVQALFER